MSRGPTRYDFALVLIPLALLAAAVAGVVSPLSMPVALAAASVFGAGVMYEVLVREPPLD